MCLGSDNLLFSEINKDLDHNSQAMCLFIFVNFQKVFSLTANKEVYNLCFLGNLFLWIRGTIASEKVLLLFGKFAY